MRVCCGLLLYYGSIIIQCYNTLYLSLIVLYVGLLTVAAREVQCRFFVQINSVNCFHFLI